MRSKVNCCAGRWSWLPLVLFAGAIVLFRLLGSNARYEPAWLLPVLNLIFVTAVSLVVAVTAARTYLAGGSLGLLALGAGVLVGGFATAISSVALPAGQIDRGVTVHDLGVLVAGAGHLIGVVLLRLERPMAPPRRRRRAMVLSYAMALAMVGLIYQAVDWSSPFYVPGEGPTQIRGLAIGAAVAFFAVTAFVLLGHSRRSGSPFTHWYGLGLLLTALGLVAVALAPVVGSPLSWVGRAAQYVGGAYLLVAVWHAARKGRSWMLPMDALRETQQRYNTLVECSPDPILVHAQGRWVFMNPAATHLFGGTAEQIIGTAVMDRVAPADRQLMAERILLATTSSRATPLQEVRLLRLDGSEVRVEATEVAVSYAGEPSVQMILRDVSQRRQAENALAEEQRRGQLLYQTMPLAAVHQDADGRILYLNPAAERTLGITLGSSNMPDLARRFDCVREDGTPFATEELPGVRCLRTGLPESGVVVGIRNGPGESRRWLRVNTIPLFRDREERPYQVYSLLEDITQSISAQQALQSSELRYQRLVETADEGIWVLDAQARTTFVNPKMAAMLGYSPQEMNGRPLFDFMDDKGRRVAEENLARRQQGIAEQHDFCFVRKDGSRLWTIISTNPLRDDSGNYLGALGMITDVTARRAAEAALRQSNERFLAAATALNEGLTDWDLLSGEIWYNEAFGRLFGPVPTEKTDLVAWWRDRLHPADHDGVVQRLEQAMRDSERWTAQYRHRRDDGGYVDVLHRAVITRNAAGAPVRLISGLMDVTEQRAAERALHEALLTAQRARADAEQASTAKDHFIAMLSHELRTPLTPALLAAEMLAQDESLPSGARGSLASIARHISLEARLVDDLLEMSHIVSGKLPLRHEPVEVTGILREVARICAAEINAKQQHLTLELCETACVVFADPARLHQVFWNLLRNANKYTPQRGSITVRCDRTVSPEGSCVAVRFSDTGAGIEPEALPRLFRPFEQARRVTSETLGGLGLGLAISKAVVDLHGGRIEARSDGAGKGATFIVELPLASSGVSVAAAPPRRDKKGALAGVRILLVEDHPDTANLLSKLLRSRGCVVRMAGSVSEARALARQERFDVLLSDLGLPDGSGQQLMSELRDTDILGIAISGYGAPEDIAASRAAGFAEHLIKPVRLEALCAAVARLVKDRAPSPAPAGNG